MAQISKYIADRKFEERGYLEFFFCKSKLRTQQGVVDSLHSPASYSKVKIPFFENPTINESKSARLGRYKPIGRNGDLYAFLGSDSRNLSLSFNLTLPHIVDHAQLSMEVYKRREGYFDNLFNGPERDLAAEKARFTKIRDQVPPGADQDQKILQTIQAYEDQMLSEIQKNPLLYNPYGGGGSGFFGLLGNITAGIAGAGLDALTGGTPGVNESSFFNTAQRSRIEGRLKISKIKALYYFWINVARTATLGGPLGSAPPIIRLSFGPMYQRVPFIATKYNLSIDEIAGYDSLTLLPRRVKIMLSLEEIRAGNFSTYAPAEQPDGSYEVDLTSENPADWGSILTYGSTDPRISPIGDTPTDVGP